MAIIDAPTRVLPVVDPPTDRLPAVGAADPHRRSVRHRILPAALRSFRPDIQGLRAIAVLLVVLYHAGVPGVTGGYIGVDVFFVISGFLITGKLVADATKNGRVGFLTFYAGRIRRLLPAAAIVVLVTLAAARLWGSVFQIRNVGWDAILTAVYGINYRLAATGVDYQQADGPESPLQHFWSLAVEEQFYVVWPLVIALCVVVGRRHLRAVLAVVLVAACAWSLQLSITETAANGPMAYFSIQTRAWELGVGALLAVTSGVLVRLGRTLSVVLSWAGLAAIVWSAFAYTAETPFPGSAALVPVLGTAAVIAAGCAPARAGAEWLLALRPLQGIGKVSYAWYLWHWPLIIMVPLMFDRKFAWWELLELVGLGLWLAVLTYWVVELPTSHSTLRRPAWLGVGFGLSSSVAALGAVLVVTVPALIGSGAATNAVALDGADVMAVRTAVADATRVTAAPSNLRPLLSEVATDQPVSTNDGCHADYLQVEQGACIYGDPAGQRTVVLFGDSHAQQWLPALDTAGKANHWKVVAWTKAACSIADYDVYLSQLQRPYAECVEWREATIGRIVQKHPDLVVVSQSDTVAGDRLGNAEWGSDTAKTLVRFSQVAIPVTYVMDTPYPGSDVPECTARHLDDVGACTGRRDRVWPFDGRHEAIGEALAAAGIPTVEPIDWFCTAKDCPPVVGDMLVYRDSSHMSTAYSAWLAPMLAPLLPPA